MLTHEQIKKAARLMQQVGELRPGFLNEGASGIEGPHPKIHSARSYRHKKATSSIKKQKEKVYNIRLTLIKDPHSGKIRLDLK